MESQNNACCVSKRVHILLAVLLAGCLALGDEDSAPARTVQGIRGTVEYNIVVPDTSRRYSVLKFENPDVPLFT